MSDALRYTVGLGASGNANLWAGLGDTEPRGVFVPTWEKLPPVGASVAVRLELPGGDVVEAAGTVAWVLEHGGGVLDTVQKSTWPGVGVALAALGERERDLLRRYAKNRAPMLWEH